MNAHNETTRGEQRALFDDAPQAAQLPADAAPHTLRAPCPRCGRVDGYRRRNGPHWEVRCNADHHAYFAPKAEVNSP